MELEYLQIHSSCNIISSLFLQPVVFFCIGIPLSVYPFTFWQIFGLFPVQGQCKVFVSFNIQVFCGHMLEFLLGKYIGMEWLDCMLSVYLTLKTVVVPFSFPASMYESFTSFLITINIQYDQSFQLQPFSLVCTGISLWFQYVFLW